MMLGVDVTTEELHRYHEMGMTMFEFISDLKVLRNVWGNAHETVQDFQTRNNNGG